MKGLLYKDFIASDSKWHVIWLTAFTLILAIVAFLVPGGEQPEVKEALICPVAVMIFFAYFMMLDMVIVVALFKKDTGKNCMQYILCLPVSKKEYVAARYVYVLIANYILLSVGAFWSMMLGAVCENERVAMFAQLPSMFGPSMAYFSLFIASLELPVFILFGKKKGDLVINTFVITFAVAALLYMLFGNIAILENIDIFMVMEYLQKHMEILLAVDTAGAILVGLLYFASYKFTVKQFCKKEEWDYD